VASSTITANSAARGGCIYSDTDLSGTFTSLFNCTLTNNTSTVRRGGINNNDGETYLTHCTIISGNVNSDAEFVEDPINSFISSDANLIGAGTAISIFNQSNDQIWNTNPQLAPLDNYSGPAQTMPLLPDSPAIEGTILLVGTPRADQKGNPRPSGPLPDIGAVEALPINQLMLASTDGDDIPDILEGPGNAYPHLSPSADDSAVDTDGDGSSDAEEIANRTDPLDASSRFRMFSFAPGNGFNPIPYPVPNSPPPDSPKPSMSPSKQTVTLSAHGRISAAHKKAPLAFGF